MERIKDGFHVHHLDGDHGNNDPKNLVLIEGTDHLLMHGIPLGRQLKLRVANSVRYRKEKRKSKGWEMYRQLRPEKTRVKVKKLDRDAIFE